MKEWDRKTVLLWVVMAFFLMQGCVNDEPAREDLFRPNNRPIAKPGEPQTVASGAVVQLDGSQSFDPDGQEIRFEWTLIEKPVGSVAEFDNAVSPTPKFTADTDGFYKAQLRVIEEADRNLPADVPFADQGASSDPAEVTVSAGILGPFPESGNKLILDGKHIALSTLSIDIGGSEEMTTEGWFWANAFPSDPSEVFLFAKKEAFEVVLRSGRTLAFKIYQTPTETFALEGEASWTLQAWHHVAVVIDRQKGLAYTAVDGRIVSRAPFTAPMNTNQNRFSIGGLQGKGSFIGMADEVRVVQAVRYPEVDFEPPKTLLVGDSPFIPNAPNTVHGLWHFDERVGATLFSDFSLRGNDLFRVGDTGFQPFGVMRLPRLGHRVTKLNDQSLWISGGYDSSQFPVETTERLLIGDQSASSLLFNRILVKGEPQGQGNGNATEFAFTLAHRPIFSGSAQIKRTQDAVTTIIAFDLGDKTLSGTGISTGTIDYETGAVTIKFPTPPGSNVFFSADYDYDRKGGAFHHTATRLANGEVLITGGEDVNKTPKSSAALFIPGTETDTFVAVAAMAAPRRYHAAVSLADGRALIVGGEGGAGGGAAATLASGEYFDPVSRTFSTTAPSLNIPRKLHQMIGLRECNPAAAEHFLVVGGYGADQVPVAEAEYYAPVTPTVGVFSRTTGGMAKGRVRHALSCLPDGRVLVTGGIDPAGRILDTAEIYDPATRTFTLLLTRMNSPRADHTATPLPDGKVLVAGGFNQFGQALASSETYDPAAELFLYTSTFPGLGRYGHVALPWKGGVVDKEGVLLIGGADSNGNVLPLVEIFYP